MILVLTIYVSSQSRERVRRYRERKRVREGKAVKPSNNSKDKDASSTASSPSSPTFSEHSMSSVRGMGPTRASTRISGRVSTISQDAFSDSEHSDLEYQAIASLLKISKAPSMGLDSGIGFSPYYAAAAMNDPHISHAVASQSTHYFPGQSSPLQTILTSSLKRRASSSSSASSDSKKTRRSGSISTLSISVPPTPTNSPITLGDLELELKGRAEADRVLAAVRGEVERMVSSNFDQLLDSGRNSSSSSTISSSSSSSSSPHASALHDAVDYQRFITPRINVEINVQSVEVQTDVTSISKELRLFGPPVSEVAVQTDDEIEAACSGNSNKGGEHTESESESASALIYLSQAIVVGASSPPPPRYNSSLHYLPSLMVKKEHANGDLRPTTSYTTFPPPTTVTIATSTEEKSAIQTAQAKKSTSAWKTTVMV